MVSTNDAAITNTGVSRPEGGAEMWRGIAVEPCMQHARNTCTKPHVRHRVTQSDRSRPRPGVTSVLQLRGWPDTAGKALLDGPRKAGGAGAGAAPPCSGCARGAGWPMHAPQVANEALSTEQVGARG